MKAWVYERSSGRLLWEVESGPLQIAAQETEYHGVIKAAEADPKLNWVEDGAISSRPITGLTETASVTAGAAWTIPDVPAGTIVRVDTVEVGTVDADGCVLRFDYADTYTVELIPPFPWVGALCQVTVA